MLKNTRLCVGFCLAWGMAACGEETELTDGSYLEHDESSDFESEEVDEARRRGDGPDRLGLPLYFNRNYVVADDFFSAARAVSGDAIQAFLENTPYGGSSWLAGASVDGRRAADAIADASRRAKVNPVIMLARMQVEESLISKSKRPSQSVVDYAFGCGCPDRARCSSQFRGLGKQIECAANTLVEWYGRSADGSGPWRRGAARRASDGHTIRPASHATAALYAYTPWVLEGRGGNWLVWNVTRRFARAFANRGYLAYP